jgi:hypothetical protein
MKWSATVELSLGGPEPVPRARAVPEDLFAKRGDPGDTHGAIRLLLAQRCAPRASMRQGASRDDQRVDFIVGQTCPAEAIDCSRGEAILDQSDEVLVRVERMQTEHLFNTFQ